MNFQLILLVSMVGLSVAFPVIDFTVDSQGPESEEIHHTHRQEGQTGTAVTGEYSWESPEGIAFVVRYIADDKGFRVIESNATPTHNGLVANGEQGNLYGSSEEFDSFEK
ncbi:unnamed protein product [Meganyctiphanes norvegica]|uniref:Cuticle protein n=1 Tax=Meganyctiphanes norvegica TaxID=48144 RepID=A0AAV2RH53_MEGNR